MTLKSPFKISARLLPALQIGKSWLSLEYGPVTAEGRQIYKYYIDTPDFDYIGSDLQSGCCGGSLQSAFDDMLCFMHCDPTVFSDERVQKWCEANAADIEELRTIIEEANEAGDMLIDETNRTVCKVI